MTKKVNGHDLVAHAPALIQYETGATRSADCEDVRFDLIPPEATRRLAARFASGAKAHGDRNWERGMPASVILNHLESHLARYKERLAELRGAGGPDALAAFLDADDDLAAIAWGAAALMWHEANRPEFLVK